MKSKKYWNKKIIEWEKSSYNGVSSGMSLIEKIAGRFRKPIKKRKGVLLEILKDLVKDKTVLELGCGSGGMCFDLVNLGVHKVIGIDIADEAIKVAQEKAVRLGIEEKAVFSAVDLRDDIELPASDFVIGLGFIDYIDIQALKPLFVKIKCKFIFSFPEKKTNFINILQFIYLKSQGCSHFYKFERKEFDNIPGMRRRCQFFAKEGMTFITNFNPMDLDISGNILSLLRQ